jgi:hypothetical protein
MRFYLSDTEAFDEAEKIDLIYLVNSSWDDWFRYSTLYNLYYYDTEGVKSHLGSIKIGQKNMENEQRRPNLPDYFETLDDNFFSQVRM